MLKYAFREDSSKDEKCDSCTTMFICLCHRMVHLKMPNTLNFMLSMFYHTQKN